MRRGSRQRAAGNRQPRVISYCPLPAACCLLFSFLTGCGGSPSAANIQLRKENQKLSDERDQLILQHAADTATIQACQDKAGITPALSVDRLDKLFTAHDLSLGRLTGGHQAAGSSFDDGLTVYVVPTDEQGEPIKAAGSFKVEAFDLADPAQPLVGQWSFDLDQTRTLFYVHFSLYTYVLQVPWQTIPRHRELTVHVTFVDELTGRQLTAQRVVNVNLPPSSTTMPTTAP
jgi:hypothetical protein